MYDVYARRNLFVVYFVFIGITILFWVLSKSDPASIIRFPYISLTQISGLIAISLISLNLLLSARLKIFEDLFGGLDKVYRQHNITGRVSFAFMLAHPVFLLFTTPKLSQALEIYIFNFANLSYVAGRTALLGFTILIVLTIFIRLPYHIWLITHRLMLIPLIATALHVFTVKSDVSTYLPLRYFIFAILFMGITAYVYKVILYRWFGPKYEYCIDKTSLIGDVVEFLLKPKDRRIYFEPGQFVFVKIFSDNIPQEEHPFSISSSPIEEQIRLSIRQSGDYTKKLQQLKKGAKIMLYGPYGQFGKRALSSKQDVVMIAGGIGITPFLSILKYIRSKKIRIKVKLIYSFKSRKKAVYSKELSSLLGKNLIENSSDTKGQITIGKIKNSIGNFQNKLFLLCGPTAMMKSLSKQLLDVGVKRKDIVFESFDLKD